MAREGHREHRRRYDSDREREDRDRDRDRERRDGGQRRRQGHRATDSNGELLPRPSRGAAHESASESPSPTKPPRRRRRESETPGSSKTRSSKPLSLDALASLDKQNYKKGWGKGDGGYDQSYAEEVRAKEAALEDERKRSERRQREQERRERQRSRGGYQSGYESAVVDTRRSGDERRDKRRSNHDRERRRREQVTDDERRQRKRSAHEKERRRDYTESEVEEKKRRREKRREERKRRVVSGPLLEEGGHRDDDDSFDHMPEKRGGAGTVSWEEEQQRKKKKKRILIGVVCVLVALAVIIPVAVVLSRKNSNSTPESDASASSGQPSNSNLDSISESDIPASAKGTILDPFSWYDTTDFNVTYTDATVGGLPIMGLNSTWDDDVQVNSNVPNLQDSFNYGTMKIRGINLGGWLNIEPFITPSFFDGYSTREGVIDEWTLTTKLGATKAAQTLEKHYSSFVTRQTFVDLKNAGFDHVRIPFGYWAVTTYEGDPYVPQISWRYLLRGIEWAREVGLRVNLDPHGLPGSQNGWNHSGRQGVVGWLNGTDGDTNAQRSLDIHNQLSKFFAQPRYKNLVTMYGLVNEPRMVDLNTDSVLNWYSKVIDIVRGNNITAVIVFGDGFMGLDNWQGKLQNYDNLLLDVHQYVIFNIDQLSLSHSDKLDFACKGWTQQAERSSDTATGFGPTLCGEWSQADTDCTKNLNNVGWGTRWEGTYNTGNTSTSILTPQCPTKNNPVCSCTNANADPSTYSDAYKEWLLYFALAQMESFEQGWGWFYWTWQTESATQWSYKAGMAAGIMPDKTYDRSWKCSDGVPDFGSMGLDEYY